MIIGPSVVAAFSPEATNNSASICGHVIIA
jgi:hypothetical protein